MISFVVLADGPYQYKTFRPNEDESQWWARRDAMTRMIHAACYASPGEFNGTTNEIVFVFHNIQQERGNEDSLERKEPQNNKNIQIGKGDNIGVSIITASSLCKEVSVPIESSIIRLFRSSFKKAPRIYSNSLLHTATTTLSSLDDGEGFHSLEFVASPSSSSSSSSSSSAKKSASEIAAGLSKKEIIQLLQSNCTLEFLRKHHLNGNLDLIAKKRNKSEIDLAYQEYHDRTRPATEPSDSSKITDLCNIFQFLFQRFRNNVTKNDQADGFKKRKRKEMEDETKEQSILNVVVLLLHEDYSEELPVFQNPNLLNDLTNGHNTHVVCIVGGVRDISNEETEAIFRACVKLQIPCVGANLGRTAEFTSKIITAMVVHAQTKVLFHAVRQLTDLTTLQHHSSVGGCLTKLPSIRKGHITWDGHNTVTSKGEIPQMQENPEFKPFSHDFIIIAKIHLSSDVIQQSIRPNSQFTMNLEIRENLHGLIQLVISSLWKSRIGSSDPTIDNSSNSGDRVNEFSNNAIVNNVLYLVFENNRIVRLDEKLIQLQIRNYHLSAPNEHQILQLLQRILESQPDVPSAVAEDHSLIADIVQEELKRMSLSHNEKRKIRKHGILEDNFYFICANCCVPIGKAYDTTLGRSLKARRDSLDSESNFLKAVYNGSCSCCLQDGNDDHHSSHHSTFIITIGFADFFLNEEEGEEDAKQKLLLMLYDWKYSTEPSTKEQEKKIVKPSKKEKRLLKLQKYIKTINTLSSLQTSPISSSLLITLFQHYAYHNRLLPAIKTLPSLK